MEAGPRSSAGSSAQQGADTGPCGAHKGTGSPNRVWRNAVPVVMAAQRSPPYEVGAGPSGDSACRENGLGRRLGILNPGDALHVTGSPVLRLHGRVTALRNTPLPNAPDVAGPEPLTCRTAGHAA